MTILRSLRSALPDYDFLYLGDNARAPYGNRSFDLVYRFTLDAVKHLFSCGCPLVILGCNTASAKALRSIQQKDLPHIDPTRRVLGVIRPTVEALGQATASRAVGLVATAGTVASQSYNLEIAKLFPDISLCSQACPMWVPLVENLEADGPGADYFVKRDLDRLFSQNEHIDTLILGCTHYPLLIDKIRRCVPENVNILSQGAIVADSLVDYLGRHPEMDRRLTKNGTIRFLTTEQPEKFNSMAGIFLGSPVTATQIPL